MKDKFIAYFISPTLLIFDDLAFATEFTFCDTFEPLLDIDLIVILNLMIKKPNLNLIQKWLFLI